MPLKFPHLVSQFLALTRLLVMNHFMFCSGNKIETNLPQPKIRHTANNDENWIADRITKSPCKTEKNIFISVCHPTGNCVMNHLAKFE